CESLVSKATKEDVPDLIAALKAKDAETFVRRATARKLGEACSLVVSTEAMTALKAATNDDDLEVVVVATEAWRRIPPSHVTLAFEPPLVEAYLRQGRLAEGEAALRERLKDAPRDDQARFGLGVLQFLRGVERLGQSLHKYGARTENTNIPFLRLPVPK